MVSWIVNRSYYYDFTFVAVVAIANVNEHVLQKLGLSTTSEWIHPTDVDESINKETRCVLDKNA